ncbi:MAG: hypothetical protein U9N43_07190 [Euryarchaeota archaeon]|nr:hypothetical protein [Euryarchaeota archaeon]
MFGKGKIDIAVPKSNFSTGEVISGIATLSMKKRAKAREFTISLICEQKIKERRGASRSTRTDRIYEFEHQLDEEKEYEGSGTYPFEIKIPEDVLDQQPQMPQLEGTLGTALSIAQSLAGMGVTKRTSWYLLARLDIPWGTDIKEKVQITIG